MRLDVKRNETIDLNPLVPHGIIILGGPTTSYLFKPETNEKISIDVGENPKVQPGPSDTLLIAGNRMLYFIDTLRMAIAGSFCADSPIKHVATNDRIILVLTDSSITKLAAR